MKKMLLIRWLLAMMLSLSWLLSSAWAQGVNSDNTDPVVQGKTLLLGKCAQCHTDSIWRDQRQDAKAWEATLYRMMGRGAVWSAQEIKTMALYLSTDFGPQQARTFSNQ